MKQRRNSILSLLTAGVMTLTMLPSYLSGVTLPAAAEDNPADTSPTIDFDYAVNKNIKNAQDALRDLGSQNKSYGEWVKITTDKYIGDYVGNYNNFPWRHATFMTATDSDEYSLRKYLESTDEKDKYVALSADDERAWNYWKNQKWRPITITTNKVLDLNGLKSRSPIFPTCLP